MQDFDLLFVGETVEQFKNFQFNKQPRLINEGSNTSMTATTQAAPKAKPKPAAVKEPRSYRITKQLTLDLTDPMSLVQQLQGVAASEGEGENIVYLPVVVYVRVGEAKGINPKSALEGFGAVNDMSGDYDVVAETSITPFKNVSTEVKRKVSFA